ncbi:MAG TPA: O-antigen ligase family protein [Solirubrobacterales bacterium]|nr:O-antigen ligase family protein [Solirubrobacterales bacterium]
MSDFLAGAGLLIAAAASAAAILLPAGRLRSIAMLAAIVLFPILILGDQWHTSQIVDLRHSTGRIIGLAAIGIVTVTVLAYIFRRWPTLLPLAIVAALPFRIPLHAGGDTANLLVPLYLVIAGGALAALAGGTGGEAENGASLPRPQASPPVTGPASRAALWLPRVLAAVVVLYALQTLYSEDFSKGLQNACFFLVPFTVAYALIQDVKWDNRLLKLVLIVVAAEALLFVGIGTVEYVTRSLFWNDAVIRSNEFHTYFRINSVFWDPNVFGRYLALVLVVVTTALLWARDRRDFWLLAGTILVLWIGLAQTFSQSSFIALLAGLAVLAAIRWSWRWTLAAVVVGLVGAVLVVTLVGGKGISFNRLNIDTSGRASLVQGGLDLFGERPIWGYGSGSFQQAYAAHRENKDLPVSVSHTEPVTVAAEQGLVGLALYLALIVVALWAMTAGLKGRRAGRAAVLAAFVALLVHTMSYAGFFEDPITWVLLAIGAALASTPFVAAEVRDPT